MTTPQAIASKEVLRTSEEASQDKQPKLPWLIQKFLSFTILDKAMKPIGWCVDKILGNKL